MDEVVTTRAPDDRHGDIEIALVRGRSVTVSGPRIPSASLEVVGDAGRAGGAPIGTRDAGSLRAMLDGEALDVRPGPGRVLRSSFRVDVWDARGTLRLVPTSATASTLSRDDGTGRRVLATFERDENAVVTAQWLVDGTVTTGESQDATVGYLLAAAFATGAQRLSIAILDHL